MAPDVGGSVIDWGDSGGSSDYPTESDVRLGVVYGNGQFTGTLSVPSPSIGVSGSVDINAIKENIRYVLDAANASGGSPIDLSANLTTRIKTVLKVNPEKLRPDAPLFPCVTVFMSEKKIEPKTIAADQVNAKRKAIVTFKVVGLMWNDNMTTYKEDPSDNDLEYLMENIEVILRHYPTVGNVNWQIPSAVTYHASGYDEETHMRVGILSLETTIFY
jgi:hypothetical protein